MRTILPCGLLFSFSIPLLRKLLSEINLSKRVFAVLVEGKSRYVTSLRFCLLNESKYMKEPRGLDCRIKKKTKKNKRNIYIFFQQSDTHKLRTSKSHFSRCLIMHPLLSALDNLAFELHLLFIKVSRRGKYKRREKWATQQTGLSCSKPGWR